MRKLDSLLQLIVIAATLGFAAAEAQTLPVDAAVERLATGFNFTEGPVYDGNGSLYFSNLYFNATASQILRYNISTGSTDTHRQKESTISTPAANSHRY
jgi:sugar lactone lactonase YvrE